MSETLDGEDPGSVIVDNRTGLQDSIVLEAVSDFFVENASLAWGHESTFQTYANNGGSMLARTQWSPPTNVIEEIKLARDLAERDDDVAATMGMMLGVAFSEGMENLHEHRRTSILFNKAAGKMNLDMALQEMYREFLIANSFTSLALMTRESVRYQPDGSERQLETDLVMPRIGVIPAEQIRVIGNTLLADGGDLVYVPPTEQFDRWLTELFAEETTPARRRAMRLEDPVSAAMFTERIPVTLENYAQLLAPVGSAVYRLNTRMAHRMTGPRGAAPYPRPILTRNFALLEAKRLLNIMDYALLQGGASFIVVAKKGTDERPALPPEVANLKEVVRRASKTGVIVGDHRLSFEIITPKLDELLSPEKRNLLGRKLAGGLLRVPEMTADAGVEGVRAYIEMLSRVIANDRRGIKRHVERTIYEEINSRNGRTFSRGVPKLWFPKIVLADTQFFTDYIIKLHDRGVIPNEWLVEAGGFDYDAGRAIIQAEHDRGDHELMQPVEQPVAGPNGQGGGSGPQDNNTGRPRGGSPANGRPGSRPGRSTNDPAAPRRRITRNAGETVRAVWDEELTDTVRIGEITYDVLDEYGQYDVGRITSVERAALDDGESRTDGPVMVQIVNPGYEIVRKEKVLRFTDEVSMVVGRTKDDAIVAKAVIFRQPKWTIEEARDWLARWGFPVA